MKHIYRSYKLPFGWFSAPFYFGEAKENQTKQQQQQKRHGTKNLFGIANPGGPHLVWRWGNNSRPSFPAGLSRHCQGLTAPGWIPAELQSLRCNSSFTEGKEKLKTPKKPRGDISIYSRGSKVCIPLIPTGRDLPGAPGRASGSPFPLCFFLEHFLLPEDEPKDSRATSGSGRALQNFLFIPFLSL